MYKIDSIVELDTAEYTLRHPKTGAELGVVFTLAGPGHDKAVSLQSSRTARAQATFKKTGSFELLSYEEQQAQRVETAIARVLGWRGADVEYSKDAAREWFSKPSQQWVVRQIADALDETARFISDSAQN